MVPSEGKRASYFIILSERGEKEVIVVDLTDIAF
jgi:hypothetical protein